MFLLFPTLLITIQHGTFGWSLSTAKKGISIEGAREAAMTLKLTRWHPCRALICSSERFLAYRQILGIYPTIFYYSHRGPCRSRQNIQMAVFAYFGGYKGSTLPCFWKRFY